MPSFRNYHVGTELAGVALVKALKSLLPDESWSRVKTLVSRRQVQLNGNLCLDESRRLSSGDVVKIWEHPLPKPVTDEDVRILYIDEHLIVAEKPAGMTTLRHPEERQWPARRKQLQPTMDEALTRLLAKKSEHRSKLAKATRVRAVHRLDRDTSGVMVFALTPQAEQALVRMFSKHRVQRAYIAVVYGHVTTQTLETWLVRDRGDGLRGSTPQGAATPDAQRAITHVRLIKPFESKGRTYSIVECRLETGRTHQIRIHLSEIGHRLCGEKTYTHRLGERPEADLSEAPRQALHAAVLGFQHPVTGKMGTFRTRLPEDLRKWLSRLERDGALPETE